MSNIHTSLSKIKCDVICLLTTLSQNLSIQINKLFQSFKIHERKEAYWAHDLVNRRSVYSGLFL